MAHRGVKLKAVAVLATALLGALSLAGCGESEGRKPSAKSPEKSEKTSAKPSKTKEAVTPPNSCDYAGYFDEKYPRYDGRGPHRVALVGMDGLQMQNDTLVEYGEREFLPGSWDARDGDDQEYIHPGLTLTVCWEAEVDTDAKPQVDECSYDVDKNPESYVFDLYPAKHHYTIYESRTAEKVAEFTVDGEGCPDTLYAEVDSGGKETDTSLAAAPDPGAVKESLRTYVENAR